MNVKRPVNPRLVAMIGLALIVLVALIFAGGSFGSSSSDHGTQNAPPPTPTEHVQGTVIVRIRHLQGHTWAFRYVVRNTGTVPISGFQLNSPPVHLFHIAVQRSWTYYGSGVCGKGSPSFLIYWSTGTKSDAVIQPNHSAPFSFRANTSGTKKMLFSLSWGSAGPQFASVTGPAPSSLRAGAPCGR